MDKFDIAILNLVQQNCRLTAEQLSTDVGLSPSACQRRLTMAVEVTLEREHSSIMDDFKKSMTATPEVMQCYYVTGEVDFILILTARDMPHYEQFTHQFFFDNPDIRRFHTMVVMDRVKPGLSESIEIGSDKGTVTLTE